MVVAKARRWKKFVAKGLDEEVERVDGDWRVSQGRKLRRGTKFVRACEAEGRNDEIMRSFRDGVREKGLVLAGMCHRLQG